MNSTKARKVLMSVAALAVTGAIAGAGTWASFSSTRTATQNVSAGTVVLELEGAEQDVTFEAIDNIAPGDTWDEFVHLTNASSLALSDYSLTGTDAVPAGASLVPGDHGLKVTITKCDVIWTGTTCAEGAQELVGKTTAAVTKTDLAGHDDVYLRFAFELPSEAGNTYQGKSATLTYTFDAQQRAEITH